MPDPAGSRPTVPGDRLEELFEAHHRALLAYAARRSPTLADAEDVVAEVFLVAWRRLEDVPAGDGALPWLYGVARRTLGNQRRGFLRRGRLQHKLEQTSERPMQTPSPDSEPALEALGRLSADDQEL
ncbi:MAG: RNA polymerase subunit sigma-24, partial [Chloroflexi bacterium]